MSSNAGGKPARELTQRARAFGLDIIGVKRTKKTLILTAKAPGPAGRIIEMKVSQGRHGMGNPRSAAKFMAEMRRAVRV